MTVDTNAYNCDDAHAYMPNLELRNLLVYSLRRNDIWTFTHPFMQPDMANANYVLDGLKFGFPDGIFSVALSPNVNNRIAFFHPLASLQEFSVPTRVLKDKSLSPDKYAPGDFKDLGVRGRQAQSATHDIDQRGVLYYTEIQTNSIKCWNTQTALKPENVGTVYEDAETLTYPNDLEIDPVGDIWAMSNRLPIFIYRGLNPDEYNFHIVRGRGDYAIQNTVCNVPDPDAITLVFLLSFLLGTSCAGELKEIFKWKQVYYEGIPPEITGYDNYNNVPMGVTHHKGRLFVAIPRRAPNVLSTLNVISMSEAKSTESPLLRPYPSLEMNRLDSSLPKEERFTSIYRMRMDTCERLWFVDTGRHVTNDGSMKGHPSVVYAIDTTTDTVAERFVYPSNVMDANGASISVAVDIPNDKDCGGAFVYIPNLSDGKIFVFSLREKKMHNFFHMNPYQGDYYVAGIHFQWPDGIFSIALSGQDCRGYRTAYFHPMSSFEEFSVSTEVLRNESLSMRPHQGDDFKRIGERGDGSQSGSHYYDNSTGVIFFAEVGRNGIGCWNTVKPLMPMNMGTVMQDEKRFIYPADLNVDTSGNLWVITNTMPRWFYETLDTNEYNFRVWSAPTKEAIRGTVCEL
uniref:Putative major royal jelly protein n=1 Tax=Lutzomyia longipalpis TaxID=7200 RepID=A0A1B0CTH0_LUTLO